MAVQNFLHNYSLPEGWKFENTKTKGPSLRTKEGLVFRLDFSTKKVLFRRQALVKAIGFKTEPLSVLDLTAGWGHSAFLISQLGCKVTAVEAHPFVFYFVQESLKGFKFHNLSFILDNSLNYLNDLKPEQKPDVIFIDPMFIKKRLSPKALRILKQLVGETKEKRALFDLALKKAKKRVVVKRHKLEKPLQKNVLCSFKARNICYDVFKPVKR